MEAKQRMTPAERKRKSRANLKLKLSEEELEAYKIKERKRIAEASKKSRSIKKLSMSPQERKVHLEQEASRVKLTRRKKTENAKIQASAISHVKNDKINPYKRRQTLGKALKKVRESLPNSPNKKKAVIEGMFFVLCTFSAYFISISTYRLYQIPFINYQMEIFLATSLRTSP